MITLSFRIDKLASLRQFLSPLLVAELEAFGANVNGTLPSHGGVSRVPQWKLSFAIGVLISPTSSIKSDSDREMLHEAERYIKATLPVCEKRGILDFRFRDQLTAIVLTLCDIP
jgi:hypothetical protein